MPISQYTNINLPEAQSPPSKDSQAVRGNRWRRRGIDVKC